MNRVINTPPRVGRRAVLSIALVLSMLFFFVSCDAAKIYLPPVPPVILPDSQDIASKLPEAEIARIGLLNPEDAPENTSVSRRFVSSGASGASVMRFTVKATGEESMISEVTLSGYVYNGYVYTTSTPVTVTYPATSTDTTNEYSLEEFTINASNVAVSQVGGSTEVQVSITGSVGYLPKNDTAPASNTTITVAGTAVSSVSNIPTSDEITMDPYEGSYEIDGSEISKEESVGMDGSEKAPYTISRLNDLLRLDSLFASSRNVNIRLDNDLTISTAWASENMPEPVTISNGENVSIDFNGHTITYSVPTSVRPFLIEKGGRLTVHNGAKENTEQGGVTTTESITVGAFDNYGYLEIFGGMFVSSGSNNGAIVRGRPESVTVINNGSYVCDAFDCALASEGETIINDGYFYTESHNGGNFNYCVKNIGGEMVIKGGEVYGIQGAISTSSGSLTIYDVYSEARDNPELGYSGQKSFYAIYIAGESGETSCTINGGTFVADRLNALHVGNSNPGGDGGIMADATCSVYGGSFKSTGASYDVAVDDGIGALSLYGGIFAHREVKVSDEGAVIEPSIIDSYTAPGYHVEEIANGFEVVED